MPDEIKILRHLEEKQTNVAGVRDGEILAEEIELVEGQYVPQIVEKARERGVDRVFIICSDTKRSKMTSDLLLEGLGAKGLDTNLQIDLRVGPLIHGKYKQIENFSDQHPLVKKAQGIYVSETFDQSNPWYRHGDPVRLPDGSYKYPELLEVFESPGENQVEISIRLYRFFLDLIDENRNKSSLAVISTHYVVLSRLLALQTISDSMEKPFHGFYMSLGKLYKQEFDVGIKMTEGYGFHGFFKEHNYIFDLDLEKIRLIENAIRSDLDILQAQYMQKYGREPR